MKRVFDLLFSLSCLIMLLPLFLIVSLLIFIDGFGPVFYRQDRVGRDGQIFSMLKFRSMKVDADKNGTYFTSENDDRITRIGKFLRKSSIDELPQFINVLLGDMSLIGPRPNVPQQVSLYSEDSWKKRHKVRPGITGLAQATKRSSASDSEREELDLYYVDHQSLTLDIKIFLLTIKQVLLKGGN